MDSTGKFKSYLEKLYPRWGMFLQNNSQWKNYLTAAENYPVKRVLICSIGVLYVSNLESLLAAALTLRGVKTDILICDEALPACTLTNFRNFNSVEKFITEAPDKNQCALCFPDAFKMFSNMGLKVYRYSEFIEGEEINSIIQLIESGEYPGEQDLEEHALAGALRFLGRGDLEEAGSEAVLKKYLTGAAITARVAKKILKQNNYDCIVSHEGMYVPNGIPGSMAMKTGKRAVYWGKSYQSRTFAFSHDSPYHFLTEPVNKWENIRLTPALDNLITEYIRSRSTGKNDWVKFHKNPSDNLKHIEETYGIDFSKPCIGLLTNVIWDAQLYYPANIFSNMTEWLFGTIEYFISRPDLQLIIRAHPGELNSTEPSRQKVADEINKKYPVLPDNIFFIDSDAAIDTYAVMDKCDTVIIYATGTGIELSALGKQVIVAGEASVKNKGITNDPETRQKYYEILEQLPLNKQVEEEKIQRAKKYAFHYFFRKMIPLDYVEVTEQWPYYRISFKRLGDLMPGKSSALDIICDGIIHGRDFIFPAEEYTD